MPTVPLDRARLAALTDTLGIVGTSPGLWRALECAARLAPLESSLLILGPTGSGKEAIARLVHGASGRRGPFTPLSCADLNSELAAAELFGHERGAFTGAQGQRKGLFEQAAGGTLFFDEVGELRLEIQAKLLRVLQERQVRRVGGGAPISITARIVAATHRDLPEMVRRGAFREDLYHRLNVLRVALPPLRERPGDIVPIALRFLATDPDCLNLLDEGGGEGLSLEAQALLTQAPWPGNVRQLQNVLRQTLGRYGRLARAALAETLAEEGMGEGLSSDPSPLAHPSPRSAALSEPLPGAAELGDALRRLFREGATLGPDSALLSEGEPARDRASRGYEAGATPAEGGGRRVSDPPEGGGRRVSDPPDGCGCRDSDPPEGSGCRVSDPPDGGRSRIPDPPGLGGGRVPDPPPTSGEGGAEELGRAPGEGARESEACALDPGRAAAIRALLEGAESEVWLSLAEVARFAGVSRRTLQRVALSGRGWRGAQVELRWLWGRRQIKASSLPSTVLLRWWREEGGRRQGPLWETWATLAEVSQRTGRERAALRATLRRCAQGGRWLGARVELIQERGPWGARYRVRVGSLPAQVQLEWLQGEETPLARFVQRTDVAW